MDASRALRKDRNRISRNEAILFFVYFCFYIAYLFVYQENEILHWFSLVVFPSILLYANQRHSIPSKWSSKDSLASIGLSKSTIKNGILLAIILGFGFSALQLLLSENRQDIWNQIVSGKILIAFPLAFIFMFITAGFTEEFFFRGVLQTRIVRATDSKIFGVTAVSIMFGLYHLPYAYLNPNWPSNGDLIAAISTVSTEAILAGIILGWLYEKTNNNLLACAIMHSLFNALPAAAMLKI